MPGTTRRRDGSPVSALPVAAGARPTDRPAVAVVAVGATVVLWASAFVAIRAALPHYGPVGLTAARLLVASLAFVVVAPLRGVRLPPRQHLPRLLVAGVLGMTGYQLLLNLGQVEVVAGTASIIIATAPALTAILAHVLLGEHLAAKQWIGISIALLGVVAVTTGGGGRLSVQPAALLVLGAAIAHAAYFIALKPLLGSCTPLEATAWATWLGTIVVLPMSGPLPHVLSAATPAAHVAVLHLGVGATALGFFTWSVALRRLDASVAAVYLYLVPPVTVVIGWIVLGELPTGRTLVGGVVILVGVASAHRGARTVRRRSWPTGSSAAHPTGDVTTCQGVGCSGR